MIREINKEVLKRKEFESEIYQTLDALLIRLQKTKLSPMTLRPMFRFFLSMLTAVTSFLFVCCRRSWELTAASAVNLF